jgi:hypothetical protein
LLDPVHVKKEETSKRARNTVKIIQLITDNTRSFATASLTEINSVAYQQRLDLQEYRWITALDPVILGFEDIIGCERTILFRKSVEDFNTTRYVCGSDISVPNVPHLCCFFESLLTISKRRQSRPEDTHINQTCFEEEDFLISYRNRGLITPRYIGQYVEIERQRQLLLQRERFERFRLRTLLEETRSSAATERKLLYSESDSESDNE